MRSSAGAHEWVCITFEDPLGGKRGPDAATPGGNGLSTTDRDQISGRELLEYQNNRGDRKRHASGERGGYQRADERSRVKEAGDGTWKSRGKKRSREKSREGKRRAATMYRKRRKKSTDVPGEIEE